MERAPRVSVIMPVYNASQYLRQSVDSLLAQTLKEIEIFLVDDGSTDDSPAICDAYAASDSRIIVIHKENSGAGLSRDIALKQAVGEYVAFLDADDLLHPEALATMYAQAVENDLDVLRAGRVSFATGAEPQGQVYGSPLEIYEDAAQLKRIALCFIGQPAGESDRRLHFEGGLWSALYRRALIEKAGISIVSEREWGSEDFIFNYQITRISSRFGLTADTWLHYRLSPGSVSRAISYDKVERYCGFSQRLEQMLLRDGYSPSDASVAAMCYCLEMTRAFLKFTLLAPLPLGERLRWCRKQCELPYIRRIFKEYPRNTLAAPHRLHLALMERRAMLPLLLLTKLACR